MTVARVIEAELLALSVTVIFTPVSEVIKVVIKLTKLVIEEVTQEGTR